MSEDRDNRPLSEQYRIVAREWIDLDNAARLLEDLKAEIFAERKNAVIASDPDIKFTDAAAERIARADPKWKAWKTGMVEARTKANRKKVQLEYIRMRHSEQQSLEATQRAEMKL